jgi:predicted nucleotidyltransferase
MDVAHPVESLIPGAPGRLLGALARVDAELAVSRLAAVAGVGRTRASAVLSELALLGVVTRRQVGPTTLVRLNRENMVGGIVAELGDTPRSVADRLRELAQRIEPRPVSLTMYGSFARGTATASSDIDILAVRPANAEAAEAAEADEWAASLTNFSLAAEAVTGNKVHILDYDVSDLRRRYPAEKEDAGGQFWHSVTHDAITLAGVGLRDLVGVDHDARIRVRGGAGRNTVAEYGR